MQWTDEQRRVLETRGRSQMVSAAAGSGKTTVMTEYVTRRVMEGMGLERLCVVTFTRAAAEQMRQKIADKLRAAAEENEALRPELDKVEDAWISTVHALCGRIIRRYGAGAGLNAAGALLGDQEQANLWQEAFTEALSAGLQARMPGLELLIRLYGGRDGSELLGRVSALRSLCCSRPEGMALAEEMLRKTCEKTPEDWQRLRQEDLAGRLSPIRALLREALQAGEGGAVPEESLAVLREELAQLDAGQVPGFSGRLSTKSKGFDAEAKARVKSLRDLAKALAGKLTGKDLLYDDLSPVLPALSALVALTLDTDARYAAAKDARGGMDFTDLEQGALRIVRDPAMARELQAQFDLVLVDEYQDTNPVQEAILTAISRPNNLFTVGDGKQAIYRFRQADPAIFLARSALPDDENRVLHRLNANFRSSVPVVDFVNLVFSRAMTRERGGVAYDESQALAARAEYPAGAGAVSLLLAPAKGEDVGELGELDELSLQVQAAARFIRQRMGDPVYDTQARRYRPAGYGDFAVLLRKRKGRVAPVAQMLEACGIPACASGGDWTEQPEIQETCDLLRLLDNRRRDMELLTCLHSAYGRLTLAELWEIRRAYPQGSFADAAELFAQSEGALAGRLRAFLNRMDGWREDAAVLPPDELIDRILEESGYYCAVGAMSAGENRQANLRLLVETASGLAGSRYRGLYGLLRYLDETAASGSRVNAIQAQGAQAQTVQIVTIHGSKGLEYPIVLLLDMDAEMNAMPYREDELQMDPDLGFGCRTLAGKRLVRSTAWKLLADKLRREDTSEEVRILYVALTRAMEQLVLVMNEPTKSQLQKWLLPPEQAVQAGDRYADWIMPVLLRCRGAESLGGTPEYPVTVSVLSPAAQEQAVPEPILPPAGPPDGALLEELNWQYPHVTGLPAKMAATDSVGEPDPGMTLPGRSGRLSARERGTLTHRVLEHWMGSPEETLAAMAAAGLIRPQDRAEVETGWLERWMAHPLYARMQQSARVERELPFTLRLPAREVTDTQADDPVMVQGVIDLAFVENGGWVLVDFKTGDVVPGREADYVRHYHPQLALYRKALTVLTGLPVREAGLYLLPNAKFVEDKDA